MTIDLPANSAGLVLLPVLDNPCWPIGATLDWALYPTRVFRWRDGSTGILHADYYLHPECYSRDGRYWPIDPATGKDLPVYG
jgi:hypothetical protein